VTDLLKTVATAIGAFAATNIDDFVLLTILFIDSQRGGLRRGHIIAGQYLGFAVLLVISAVAAAGLVVIPPRWVGLLGLLPLTVSVRGFVAAARHRSDYGDKPVASNGLLSVATVTVANGGDNLAVYVLLFHTQASPDTAITIIVFLLLLAAWCASAALVGTHARVISALISVGQWLVPVVYFIIGVVILVRSGVLIRLAGFL
jgi:cadmium resistance protein CadD (predicted permease)